MQNILIPTNFSVQSLDCISALCEQHAGNPLRLVFVHMFKLSDSIGDLLMLSRRNKEYSYIGNDFYEGCNALKNTHANLIIKIDFFYGSSMANFRDFLEANEIDAVLEPSKCMLNKLNPLSADPLLFINKSRIPIVSIVNKKEIIPAAVIEEVLIPEEELMAG